jgi:hypothetical protein
MDSICIKAGQSRSNGGRRRAVAGTAVNLDGHVRQARQSVESRLVGCGGLRSSKTTVAISAVCPGPTRHRCRSLTMSPGTSSRCLTSEDSFGSGTMSSKDRAGPPD